MMEIRLNKNDGSIHVTGYVNAAERESRVLTDATGPFVETVASGTWARAIHDNPDVGVMFNHQRDVDYRNLDLYEDAIGCRFSADIYDEEVRGAAERGELQGFSFGFTALDDEWSTRDDGMRTRRLKDIRLYEVSILNVTPAYIATTIEARDENSEAYEARDLQLEVVPEESRDDVEVVEPDDSWKAAVDVANATIQILKLN